MKAKYIVHTLVDGKKVMELDLPGPLKVCSDEEIKAAISRASYGNKNGYFVLDEVIRVEEVPLKD